MRVSTLVVQPVALAAGILVTLGAQAAAPSPSADAEWRAGVTFGGVGASLRVVGAAFERRLGDAWWLVAQLQGSASHTELDGAESDSRSGAVQLGARYELNPGDPVTVSLDGLVSAGRSEVTDCADDVDGEWLCSDYTSTHLSLDLGFAVAVALTEALALRLDTTVATASWSDSEGLGTPAETAQVSVGLSPRLGLFLAF